MGKRAQLSSDLQARRDRFERACDVAGISAAAVAKKLRFSRQYLSAVLVGRVKGRTLWPQVARLLHVEAGWLLEGTGPAPAWATQSVTISRREPFAEALTLLGTVMKSVTEEGRRRDVKVDSALEALETARLAIERL